MKRIIIVHGWDFTPDSNWYLWLKEELMIWKDQLDVKILKMPNTEAPVIEEWVNHIKQQIIPKPDKNTYFVGHSIGCQTIMRYLETLDSKIGGALFVAGWFNLKNLEDEDVKKIVAPWLNTSINFGKIKNKIGYLRVILSDNDPYNYLEENARTFKERLNAFVYIEDKAGHFTGDKYQRILTELLNVLRVFIKK